MDGNNRGLKKYLKNGPRERQGMSAVGVSKMPQ
ncbi:hypothetical protein CGRA01v4_00304 [Colletotrichum graminicola]|nr:hypothetical protein CGRA01v4_00304 [Colletotrichum graminicola]